MKIMIAVLVTLAILILFHVLYFTYCNLTYKGDEDGKRYRIWKIINSSISSPKNFQNWILQS